MKNRLFSLVVALWPLGGGEAMAAADCAAPAAVEAPLDGPLQPFSRVEDYRVTLQICHRAADAPRLATRTMRIGGAELILTVDPQSLATRLERAACWTCAPTTAEAQANTRYIAAVNRMAAQSGKVLPAGATWLDNAGLTHAAKGDGVFVTGDLCPSRNKLDRAFLQSLEQPGGATPVALSVSGLWLKHHAEDFAWLRREKAEGRLAISFVNHSYRHPYTPGLPNGRNFLLVPGLDLHSEILDVERYLIANGETPSVFFRFPGLISAPALMDILREKHLIPLGADAWLALPQNARPGSIVLVHPNGNEPFGLSRFRQLQQADKLPRPLRPIDDAP